VIIFVICIAALVALFGMDFDYFKSQCINEVSGKARASTAISLLWKSGPDTSLITDPAASSKSVSGGLLGGGIAVAAGAPAAIGAVSEDPKAFGKAIIFVALGEGVALYGMLISILILNKIG
jgi:F0F1-type ATP synthase membrane subunit c/vacuolar-type H+-ATPase subunit K